MFLSDRAAMPARHLYFYGLKAMSRYYSPPKTTGMEYVLAVEDLVDITISRCGKLPKEWKDYSLDPLVEAANRMDDIVNRANGVYVNPKSQSGEELIEALEQRIVLLQECMKEFSVFDRNFDKLMRRVDFSNSEKVRLKNLLLQAIKEASEETKKEIVLEGRFGENDFSYISANGSHSVKLMLTHHNVDHWLDVRHRAEKRVAEKLNRDRDYLKHLRAAAKSGSVDVSP